MNATQLAGLCERIQTEIEVVFRRGRDDCFRGLDDTGQHREAMLVRSASGSLCTSGPRPSSETGRH